MNTRSIILTVSLLLTLSTSMAAAPGDLDPTFGNGGIAIANHGNTPIIFYSAWAMAIQPDGKIIVVGEGTTGGHWDSAVVRYNPNGSLDTTFNGSGKVLTPVGRASSVAIQADGKIIAAGGNQTGGSQNGFTLVRYNSDGSLDTSFNGTGVAVTPVGDAGSGASDLAIQPDGKIVVVGSGLAAQGTFFFGAFAVVRYNPDGSLDTSFGSTGKILIPP